MTEDFFTFLAFLPAILILYFFYKQDKNRKEPRGVIVKVFFVGFIVAILASIFNEIAISLVFKGYTSSTYFNVADSFKFGFIPGFIEESLKMICILLLVYSLKKFDERTDGVFYTVTVGMGFAAIENLTYVSSFGSQGYGLQVAFMRALSAVPMHAIFGAIMGYFIGKAKFSEGGIKIPLFLAGWFGAVLMHGTYNSTLFAAFFAKKMGLALVPILLLIGGITIAILLMKKLVKEDKMSIDFSVPVQPQTFPQQPSVQQTSSQQINSTPPPTQQGPYQQNQSTAQEQSISGGANQQAASYCSNCGTKIVKGAGFCQNCGAKIE